MHPGQVHGARGPGFAGYPDHSRTSQDGSARGFQRLAPGSDSVLRKANRSAALGADRCSGKQLKWRRLRAGVASARRWFGGAILFAAPAQVNRPRWIAAQGLGSMVVTLPQRANARPATSSHWCFQDRHVIAEGVQTVAQGLVGIARLTSAGDVQAWVSQYDAPCHQAAVDPARVAPTVTLNMLAALGFLWQRSTACRRRRTC
jgi:hypothetical protein